MTSSAAACGEVIDSPLARPISLGQLLFGMTGWQEYVDCRRTGERAMQVLPDGVPRRPPSGFWRVTGMTALLRQSPTSGQVKWRATLSSSSGAAGATGFAPQGRSRSYQGREAASIGIARQAPDKYAFIVNELGYDEAIDYKNEKGRPKRLRETCPNWHRPVLRQRRRRSITNDCLANLALRGRVVLCGAISMPSAGDRPPPGPATHLNLAGPPRAHGGLRQSSSTTSTASRPAQLEVAGWIARQRIMPVLGAHRPRAWRGA